MQTERNLSDSVANDIDSEAATPSWTRRSRFIKKKPKEISVIFVSLDAGMSQFGHFSLQPFLRRT